MMHPAWLLLLALIPFIVWAGVMIIGWAFSTNRLSFPLLMLIAIWAFVGMIAGSVAIASIALHLAGAAPWA